VSAIARLVPGSPVAAMPIGLVADDLTGALDAAAPFARADAPVAVLRGAQRARGSFALDAGTRGGTQADAEAAAARSAGTLCNVRTAFRKIDSLLRGFPAAEIVATARAGRFASVVVAPAFPAQGRITLQGRQYARHRDGTYRLIDVDLALDLAARGLPVRTHAQPASLAGNGMFLCDAEYDSDLQAIAAARPRLKPPVLWCGSAGLARALAGPAPRVPLPTGQWLGIIGSRHATSLGEIAGLRASDPEAVIEVAEHLAIDGAIMRARIRLSQALPVLIALRLPPMPEVDAAQALGALARAAVALVPRALFASGGDTLAALCDATQAARLDVIGEVAPGIPVSRLVGGRWHGVTVVSKSGAFAGADVLAQLFGGVKEKRRVRA
jgi:uncharacterized protein YgbK (DUF1537 family)